MNTQSRNYQLDIIRSIACIMVIGLHAPQPGINTPGVFLAANSMLVSPCIGLFFMVSGALLLPVRLSYKDFIKRRASRILFPTLIFSVFYIIFRQILVFGELSAATTIKQILLIPFHFQGSNVLWYMYPLLGVYLVAPIISPFFDRASKNEIRCILFLWLISMCLPTLSNYIQIAQGEEGILYYFFGYLGYFILGFYLRKYVISTPPIYLYC